MRLKIMLALVVGLAVALPNLAMAELRLALVIGNSNYAPDIGMLPNPANDAGLVGAALERQGFDVAVVRDVDQKGMKRALTEFSKRLTNAGPGSTALFYYAGHGIQAGGTNYLIPLGANITSEADIEFEAIEADSVLRQVEYGGSQVSIIILDACRNNPLSRSMRAATRGLAQMEAPTGSFIAYSTAPGQTASDGTGRNSPFAMAFAEEVAKPGPAIEETFRNVRAKVISVTNSEQVPWDSSSLTAPFYFSAPQVAAIAPAPEPAAAPSNATELVFWQSVKDSTRPGDFEAYLKKYPSGDFVDLAKSRIADLKAPQPQQQAAVAAPAPAPSADTQSIDLAFWNSVKDSRNPSDFVAYLQKFPAGEFTGLAQSRLAAARSAATSTAAVAAPVAEPDPVFESPLVDGTIVLSPKVKAALDKYLTEFGRLVPSGDDRSWFYVSTDGKHFAYDACKYPGGGQTATSNSCKGGGTNRTKTTARNNCAAGSDGECVVLFTEGTKQRDFKVYGQQ